MGVSYSKASMSDVTNVIHTVVNKSQQSCGNAASASNIVDINHIHNADVEDIDQYATASVKCWASNVAQTTLRDDISKALDNLAQSQGSVLGGLISGGFLTYSDSEVENITKVVNQNYNINTQTCADAMASNIMRINHIDNSRVRTSTQIAKSTVECVFSNSDYTDIITQLTDSVNNAAKTKQLNIWGILLIVAIVAIAIIIAVVYMVQPGHIDPALMKLAAEAAVV